MNWATGSGDHGSGGFVAFNGDLTVNIGGAGQQVQWDGQTGDSRFFVRDGAQLVFGTPAGTGRVEFRNPLALDAGTPGTRTTRLITAFGNSNLTADIRPAAERTRLTGVISGSPTTNLSFGPSTGVVELSAANTYAGNTFIGTTVVVTNTAGSATGAGNVAVEQGRLFGSGTIAPASGNGVQVRGGLILLQSDAGPSNLTIGSAGADNDVLFTPRLTTASQLVARLTPAGSGRLTVLGTGQITLTPGTGLFLDPATDFAPTPATVLAVLDNRTGNAVDGVFTINGVAVGQGDQGTAGNWRFTVSYAGSVSGSTVLATGGNSVVLYDFAPVPEPAGLLAAAALAVAGRRALRRRGPAYARPR